MRTDTADAAHFNPVLFRTLHNSKLQKHWNQLKKLNSAGITVLRKSAAHGITVWVTDWPQVLFTRRRHTLSLSNTLTTELKMVVPLTRWFSFLDGVVCALGPDAWTSTQEILEPLARLGVFLEHLVDTEFAQLAHVAVTHVSQPVFWKKKKKETLEDFFRKSTTVHSICAC